MYCQRPWTGRVTASQKHLITEVILNLAAGGQTAMQWKYGLGCDGYPHGNSRLIYAWTLGNSALVFILICFLIEIELLGTSTGFPFVDYSYLSGFRTLVTGPGDRLRFLVLVLHGFASLLNRSCRSRHRLKKSQLKPPAER